MLLQNVKNMVVLILNIYCEIFTPLLSKGKGSSHRVVNGGDKVFDDFKDTLQIPQLAIDYITLHVVARSNGTAVPGIKRNIAIKKLSERENWSLLGMFYSTLD